MADPPVVQEPVPPWPLVAECFATHKPGHSCAQHDGSHDHVFLAWAEETP